MISIIQRRKSILSTPFTSDKKGVQMCCTIAIIALINPGISATPEITAKTSVYQEILSTYDKNKNWLECDIIHDSLLCGLITSQPQLSCDVSTGPLLQQTTVKQSVLDCTASSVEILGMNISKSSQLYTQASAEQLVSTTISILPQLSAVISRPKCED
jgi:hypothetical protein